jgi:sugar phosphate isomerase/epimerase
VPAAPLSDVSKCAIHTITTRRWSLAECIAGYAKVGIRGISVWRDAIPGAGGPAAAGKMLRDAGVTVPALVRGGFFPAFDAVARQTAIDINKTCVDEAAAIGADQVVLVCGAVPGMPLADARKQVADGLAAVLPYAAAANVRLAIEPLHPMYAADRSCVNRMAEARQLCEQLASPFLGIAADVYHIWWDPDLEREIALAGQQKTLFGFHVCDWKVNSTHPLNDRGLMGDGCIDLRTIRGWVEAAGFAGMNEVEVFSEHYWAMDPAEYVDRIRDAYLAHV